MSERIINFEFYREFIIDDIVALYALMLEDEEENDKRSRDKNINME